MNIVVIGTVYVDIKGFPEGGFIPTGRNVGRVEQVHGGVGRNIAEDVRNLGVAAQADIAVTFVSLVDRSAAGLDVLNHLRANRIDTRYVLPTEDGMGTWLAVFDEKGDVCASISKRPVLKPIYNVLNDYGDGIFNDADSILLEVDVDEEIVAKTFEIAEKYGIDVYCVISNMTIAKERLEYVKRSKCFVCNRLEAGQLFDIDTSEFSIYRMQDFLKEHIAEVGVPSMIVTMDESGSVFATLDGDSGYVPAKKVEVLDTTGAGDSFFAGAAVGLTLGRSMKEACELGTLVAAKVITSGNNVVPAESAVWYKENGEILRL